MHSIVKYSRGTGRKTWRNSRYGTHWKNRGNRNRDTVSDRAESKGADRAAPPGDRGEKPLTKNIVVGPSRGIAPKGNNSYPADIGTAIRGITEL